MSTKRGVSVSASPERRNAAVLGTYFRVGLIALLGAVMLTVPASAFAAAPTVNVTSYSKTVSGNIGVATSGVTATVGLMRGQPPSVVDTVTSAGTDASGNWTAALPTHAPGDARDLLQVHYTGTGAPTGFFNYGGSNGPPPACPPTCGPSPTLLSFLGGNVSINPAGTTITINCTSAPGGGTCSTVTVSVDGAPAPATTSDGGAHYSLTFGTAVTPSNSVTVAATVPVSGPSSSTFTLTVSAPLPGATASFVPLAPPGCEGDLVTKQIVCANLVQGNYSLVETGAHAQTVPFSVTGSGSLFSFQTLNALATGDQVALNYTGSPARLLTTLHVNTLRADISPASSSGGIVGSSLLLTTDCQAGEWFYGADSSQVCTAGGHPASPQFGSSSIQSPPVGTVGLSDELSGNLTVVSLGTVTGTAPLNGESIYNPYTAFANAAFPTGEPDATDPVALQVASSTHTPACPDPSCTAVAGNANSAGGVTLSGLVPGRYQAAWTLTDTHADTSTLATGFVVQAGGTNGATGPSGATGATGPNGTNGTPGTNGTNGTPGTNGTNGAPGANGTNGAPGATGARGPQGPPGVGVKGVKCTAKLGKRNKITVTCKVALTASVSRGTVAIRLSRGGVVYAAGHAAVRGRHAALLLRGTRPLARGRYDVLILVGRDGRNGVIRRTIKVT